MPTTYGIVDLFAGPGGLGEGFSALVENGHSPFRIGVSIEKETSAHRTLALRAFLREYRTRYDSFPEQFIDFHAGNIPEPNWAEVDESVWQVAIGEARHLELGTDTDATSINDAIAKLQRNFEDTVLIGGPPCQAYSLVGRARAKGKHGYKPEKDERHYLFREYIQVLDKHRPAAFVMENVKGMLSSTVKNHLPFEMLMDDLSSLDTSNGHIYEIRAIKVESGQASLQEPKQKSDFIVRAEEFGVPQRRHRVIIIGIRSDIADGASRAAIDLPGTAQTVSEIIGNLPPLRSGLSRGRDSEDAWCDATVAAAKFLARIHRSIRDAPLKTAFSALAKSLQAVPMLPRASTAMPINYGIGNSELLRWLERPELHALAQHEARGHMASDLRRYMFAAVFGGKHGYSPKAVDFPHAISPKHRNWRSGVFNDRFRVQLADKQSTTVTSHIAKDGHSFIHPDPQQCRSLTVREAARLQTFPDDYLFLGNRTQQYVQVGNAVPPYLARQIGRLVLKSLRGHAGQ